jgi:hypothetical protein
MLFKKDTPTVEITEVTLKKQYAFMYENFIVSSQQTLYVMLEENDGKIDALKFDPKLFKYGYPNDEISHPLEKFGLGSYGFFEVTHSEWIKEIREINKSHPSHTDSLFDKDKHYIAKFKDVTIEIICTEFEEVELTKEDLTNFLTEQISYL